jgi:hypothetical protein
MHLHDDATIACGVERLPGRVFRVRQGPRTDHMGTLGLETGVMM